MALNCFLRDSNNKRYQNSPCGCVAVCQGLTDSIIPVYKFAIRHPRCVFNNEYSMQHWWYETDREKLAFSEKKTYSRPTLTTTNLTWTGLELNPILRGDRLATNRLRHGMAPHITTEVLYMSTKVYWPHITYLMYASESWGDRGSTVVKVLSYKSEGRWFDPRWCHSNLSDRTMALGSTQPLTEKSTRRISWG
jgi:hypothetical protein